MVPLQTWTPTEVRRIVEQVFAYAGLRRSPAASPTIRVAGVPASFVNHGAEEDARV